MGRTPDIQMRQIDPRDLRWNYPAEALQRLDGFRHLADIDHLLPGRPLPENRSTEILGHMTRDLFPDDTTEHLPVTLREMSARDSRYLAHLLATSRTALETRRAQEPETPLGFLTGTREMWGQMLTGTWFLPRPEWDMVPR